MAIKNLLLVIVLLCAGMAGLGMTWAAAQTPTEQVKATVDAVLGLLRDQSLEPQIRRDKLRELIKSRFDFRAMAQRALATNWKKATKEEQDQFVDLFSQLLEWTYIGRIEAYTNEAVEFEKEIVKSNRAQVNTFIITASADIPISYRMLKKEEKWLVYDVIIEEVSLVRNYRSSYRSIVKNEGMSGLLAKMERKVKELRVKANDMDEKALYPVSHYFAASEPPKYAKALRSP